MDMKWHEKNPEKARWSSLQAQRRYQEEKRQLKMEMGCVDCGYNAHPAALDFDHTNGKTKEISKIRSMKRLLEEIERHDCVVRCANCHRIKTAESRDLLVVPDEYVNSARPPAKPYIYVDIPKNNTSGYKGVSWHKDAGKWEAKVQTRGERHHLGYFDDPAEAADEIAKFKANR